MRRRALLTASLAAGTLAAGAGARAQAPDRIFRLGHLMLAAQVDRAPGDYLLPQLESHGFVAGRNLVAISRAGPPETLPALAQELLAARPDVVVTAGFLATRAMVDASRNVPIVMTVPDPVASGFAASLARPGGNVTGVANLVVDLQPKRFELLVQAVPQARRIGVLTQKAAGPFAGPGGERIFRDAAAATGVELAIVDAEGATDYPSAFVALRAAGVDALLIASALPFITDAMQLARLALEARLPTSCEFAVMAREGCLMAYGPDRTELRRRMAAQVARVLRGAAPGEIPIEQPTLFELVVNLRTARALGITLPPTMVARADEVIE